MSRRLLKTSIVLACSLLVLPVSAQTPPAQTPMSPPQAASAAASPQNVIRLTLQQAEALALKNNPQITVAHLNALVAQQLVREQRSALLPTAVVNLTGVGANAGTRIAAGFLNSPRLFSRAAGGASFTQLVTDFGRTTNLLSSTKFQAKAEDENAVATTADIILVVDQFFYSSLETKALVRVAEDTVRARQTFVDQIRALTDAKLKSDIDLSFAKVELARSQLLLLESKNNYDTALAMLSAVLGYPRKQNFELVEETTPLTPPSPDVSNLIQQAMDQRPEIKALQLDVQAAEKFRNAERDLWMPTVSALGVVGEAPIRDNHIPNWYGAVGVNVNIPVFNGFLFNAREKVADTQAEVNRQKLRDMQDNIARDVQDAWQDANRAYERLTVTQQLLEQANLALRLGQARYTLGLGSIVEFTQAVLQQTEADIADTDAKYRYRLSLIVLAYTIAAPR
jgi:outer membrane protein